MVDRKGIEGLSTGLRVSGYRRRGSDMLPRDDHRDNGGVSGIPS